MGKKAENIFFAEGLDGIENSCNRMDICSAEPADYTAATVTLTLGNVTMAPADFTQADGSPDGRKLTVAAKTITGTADGNGNHLALSETAVTQLWYVTTTTLVGMVNTQDQDFSSFDILLRDPT